MRVLVCDELVQALRGPYNAVTLGSKSRRTSDKSQTAYHPRIRHSSSQRSENLKSYIALNCWAL
jgi:hypothetical protein